MMRTTQMESSLFLGQKKAHWAELKGGSRWRTHLWSHMARGRENETMLIHDTSQRFGLFEHASMCNQKGGVKIQNRGPEQEIPAVTCVRLIAHRNTDTSAMDRALIHWYWKMNWNWCFHSSAAGRVSSEEGNFDQLTTKLCLKYVNEKLDNKTARKREISGGWELKTPVFLRFLYVVTMQLKEWGDLLTKWTPPPYGAQSASR